MSYLIKKQKKSIVVITNKLELKGPYSMSIRNDLYTGKPLMIVNEDKKKCIEICFEKYLKINNGVLEITGFDSLFYNACKNNDVNTFKDRIAMVDIEEYDYLGLKIAEFFGSRDIINEFNLLGVGRNITTRILESEVIKKPKIFMWDVGYVADNGEGADHVASLINLANPTFFVTKLKHPTKNEWATPFQQELFDQMESSSYKDQLLELSQYSINKGNRKSIEELQQDGWFG